MGYTLYTYYRSSAAYRVRIALNLKGLPYEMISRHLRKMEQRAPEYLPLNPQGLVPALVSEKGALIQSNAIIEWLDETHPTPPLLPADPWARAQARAAAQVISCDIHPLNNLRVLRYLKTGLGQEQGAIDTWYRHWVVEGFQALETMAKAVERDGAFYMGAAPGLADICLVPQWYNAERFETDLSPYPTLAGIVAACRALPAFDKAAPENQPDAE